MELNQLLEKAKQSPYISYKEAVQTLWALKEDAQVKCTLQGKKRMILIQREHQHIAEISLPPLFPKIEEQSWEKSGVYSPLSTTESFGQYCSKLHEQLPDYLLILIQAGQAALGFFESGKLREHKIIRKYMVRKKQGKSQISYLSQKGKSRAGSRIRLANTISFFEEINQKLSEWECSDEAEMILYSCAPKMWGMFFDSEIRPPFQRADQRLKRVPKDVKLPKLDELSRIHFLVSSAFIKLA